MNQEKEYSRLSSRLQKHKNKNVDREKSDGAIRTSIVRNFQVRVHYH